MEEFCGFHDLFGSGANPVVLGQVDPADGSGGIEEEFGGARDVAAAYSSAGMNEVIAFDRGCVRIGEDGEAKAGLLCEIARDVWRIDTDRDGTNADGVDLSEVLLDTP
jgi:hypothetical protein